MTRRHCRWASGLAGTVALTTAIVGCGSNSAGSLGSVAHLTQARMQQVELQFVRCMRSHGDPGFPDPASPREFKFSLLPSFGANSQAPAFRSAEKACQHVLPTGGSGAQETAQQIRTRLADGLSFARCMRSHGISRFPDPTNQGELSVEMVQAMGIDLHAPGTLRAVQECLPASHGALTAAKVRAALKKAGG